MKTLLIYTLMTMILGSANAKPIKDIISLKEPSLPTEEYINDIPFNTELIAGESLMMRDGWEMKQEANVEDIPFDTRTIANDVLLDRIMAGSNENEVDDIPFDTRKIYQEYLMASLIREFEKEPEINDIPYQTVCIISDGITNEPTFVVVKKKSEKKHIHRHNARDGYHYTIIQPYRIDISAPAHNTSILTRELTVLPGSSL
jgi:hypothetical protein